MRFIYLVAGKFDTNDHMEIIGLFDSLDKAQEAKEIAKQAKMAHIPNDHPRFASVWVEEYIPNEIDMSCWRI